MKSKEYSQEVFSDKLITLPMILKEKGDTTFGVSSNHNLQAEFGFARGFDYFQFTSNQPASKINEKIYLWEREIKASDKYFLWVHYMDPHHPYIARSPWIEQYTAASLTNALNLANKSAHELNELTKNFMRILRPYLTF